MKTFDRSTSNRNISKPSTVTSAHIIFIPFSKFVFHPLSANSVDNRKSVVVNRALAESSNRKAAR